MNDMGVLQILQKMVKNIPKNSNILSILRT